MTLQIRTVTIADLPLAQMNKHLIEDEGSRNRMSAAQLQQRMADWMTESWQIDLLLQSEDNNGDRNKRRKGRFLRLFLSPLLSCGEL